MEIDISKGRHAFHWPNPGVSTPKADIPFVCDERLLSNLKSITKKLTTTVRALKDAQKRFRHIQLSPDISDVKFVIARGYEPLHKYSALDSLLQRANRYIGIVSCRAELSGPAYYRFDFIPSAKAAETFGKFIFAVESAKVMRDTLGGRRVRAGRHYKKSTVRNLEIKLIEWLSRKAGQLLNCRNHDDFIARNPFPRQKFRNYEGPTKDEWLAVANRQLGYSRSILVKQQLKNFRNFLRIHRRNSPTISTELNSRKS